MISEKHTYLLLMLATVVLPLAFSFEKRIRFYHKWKYLTLSVGLPLLFFIVWDIHFAAHGIWSFSDRYTLGPKLLGLPVEEWLFFVVVPYSSIFTYEVIRSYWYRVHFTIPIYTILTIAELSFIVLAVGNIHKVYAFFDFLFCALITGLLLLRKWFRPYLIHLSLSCLVALVPMLIINGVLTALPVVSYSTSQITGIHIYTIPVEDFFYFWILFSMNILLYEWQQRIYKIRTENHNVATKMKHSIF